jgi:toxin ParE1/3/4
LPSGAQGLAEIKFSNAAESDLEAIDAYSFSQFGDEVAAKYMHGFDEAFSILARHPLAGVMMPELREGARCYVHQKHRIFYSVNADVVFIIRIIHHAQDAHRALN